MCCILGLAFAATKLNKKSTMLIALIIPCLVGSALLYALGRTSKDTGPLLFGY
jgi:membrane protein DedA with SNARE-associated domain